jgi:hypothetical protein
MKHFKSVFTDIIPPNTTFVAVFKSSVFENADGDRGATLFSTNPKHWVYDARLNNDNVQKYLQDKQYSHWVKVPKHR